MSIQAIINQTVDSIKFFSNLMTNAILASIKGLSILLFGFLKTCQNILMVYGEHLKQA